MNEKIEKENPLNALGRNADEEAKQYPIEKLDLLTTQGQNGSKVYNRCTENIFRILCAHPDFKGKYRYDKWTQKKEVLKDGKWQELSDDDYLPVQRQISTMYAPFRMLSKEMVIDAVGEACRANSYDQAEDYIRGIEWDGFGRIDTWLLKAYGAPNDEYHKAVGSNFFKGMVKRIIQPGCKFDTCIILKGKQGCGKSTSFSIIAGPNWFLETTNRADDKDFLLQFRGKLIVDFCEGETMSRTDIKNLKAVISTSTDTYRAPYGREMQNIPRRCVFVMTTNQSQVLKDETGNRRYYPVEVVNDRVDIEWLKANRDQMFAEALHRVEVLKETVYEYPLEASIKIQEDNMVRSQFEDVILDWLDNPIKGGVQYNLLEGFTVDDIWCYALKCDIGRLNMRDQMSIANELKLIGYIRKRTRINGEQRWRWFKK